LASAENFTIFKAEIRAKRTHSMPNSYRSQSFFSPGENAKERFQLAYKCVRFETASFGKRRNRAVHLLQDDLEVGSAEGLAGPPQGEIERQVGFPRTARELRQHSFRVRDTYSPPPSW